MRVLLLALAAMTAGCLQTAADAPQDAAQTLAPHHPEAWVEEGVAQFYWTAGAANVQVMTINAVLVEVQDGAHNLTLEAAWGCGVPLCPVIAELYDPAGDRVAEASGDAGTTFQVEAPMAGEWLVRFSSDLPTVEAQGTVHWVVAGEDRP